MINKDENGRPRKCTSSLLSGNDLEAPVIFMSILITCCIGVEIVNDFFQFQQNKWISNRSFVWRRRKLYKYPFGMDYFFQLILLFSLFLLLFMSHIALFGTIHRSHYTISINFYLYLQYFQQKIFSSSKINKFQVCV